MFLKIMQAYLKMESYFKIKLAYFEYPLLF